VLEFSRSLPNLRPSGYNHLLPVFLEVRFAMVALNKYLYRVFLGLWLVAGMLGAAAAVVPAAVPSEGANRVALVIGNAHYKSGQPLSNPVNDATDIARKLRELGFSKVVLGVDMDKRAMRKALREFRDALRPGDVALAYYAGHGVMVGGINYMVPIDARLEDEDDVKDDALPMDDLLKMMEDSRTRTNILMLDACRDNPFKLVSRTRATKSPGLASMQDVAGEGTQIIYAARPGKTASDGGGRNGVFTTALLEHIDTPGLTLNDLVGRLADDVRRTTNNKQQPWAEGLLTGTFIFKARQSAGDSAGASVPGNRQQQEDKFWEEAKSAGNADGYQAYLEQYPSGRYAGLAKAHIKRYGGMAEPASVNIAARTQTAAPSSAPSRAESNAAQSVGTTTETPPSTPTTRATLPSPPVASDQTDTAPKKVEREAAAPKEGTILAGDTRYIGNFSTDKETGAVSGSGRVELANGDIFEGDIRQGLKQGKGSFTWKNGQHYAGDWLNDQAVGVGKITFASEDTYEGEVQLGEAHGQGTYTFASGDRYQGAWQGGKKNGKGRYLWQDGSYWEGEFIDDQQTANGAMVFPSEASTSPRLLSTTTPAPANSEAVTRTKH
jgi:uncharacterized caspase-like protein